MNLYLTYESRDTRKSLSLFLADKTISKLSMEHSVKLDMGISKISCRRSRSPENAKFGHFAIFFCRERKEIYKALQHTCTAFVLLMKPFV